MWIIELTPYVCLNKLNYYCFNPSLIHYKDQIYIFTYRVVQYDIPLEYHPWKIWDGGYKYFNNSLQVIQQKYRNYYGKELNLLIEDKNYINLVNEFDSTGIAFLKFDGNKFQLLHNVNNIFDKEMNQDARIIKIESEYFISYNMFEIKNDQTCIRHRYRNIRFNGDQILLSNECSMFDHKYKSVEKNCVFDQKKNVIYSLGKTFDVIISGHKMICTPVCPLRCLIDHYGEQNIFISSGTPPISYDSKHMLAVGHIKIAYKSVGSVYPFCKFMSILDLSLIHKHGKYIYFMFLYLFDDKYNVVKLSNPFIPTLGANHLPYLLVFPTGLCYLDGKVAISYGEGDCKCKVLVLNRTEVDSLLVDKLDLGFYFLTNCCRIQHFGYFHHFNCGDDAFRLVFKYLQRKFYPQFEIKFTHIYEDGHDLTIVGGGDVINKYFLAGIKPSKDQNLLAVGVGIPYLSEEHYLENFKHTILRNPRDYSRLKHKYNVSYFPDLTFLLPKIIKTPQTECPTPTPKKKIGMCLIQTYYKVGYEDLYENFIAEIVKFITLMLTLNCTIHLIPFCINPRNLPENDLIIMRKIKSHFPDSGVILEYDKSYTADNYVELTYNKIAEMDFNICSRFHSHIFSTIHCVPFVSLTCGRKCIEFMKDIEMTNNLYRLKTNDKDLPIEFCGNKFYNFVKDKLNNVVNIKKKLVHFMSKYSILMDKFEKKWSKLVFKHACTTRRIQLFPKIYPNNLNPANPCTNNPTSPPILDPTSPPILDPTSPPILDPTSPPILDPTSPPILDPTSPPIICPTNPINTSNLIFAGSIQENSEKCITSVSSDLINDKSKPKPVYMREQPIVEPKYIKPKYVEPTHCEPKYIEPKYVEPKYVKSTYIEPRYIEPRYIEPRQLVKPEYIEVKYVESSDYLHNSSMHFSEVEHNRFDKPEYIETTYVESPEYSHNSSVYLSEVEVAPKYIERRQIIEPKYIEPTYITKQVVEPSYDEVERHVEPSYVTKRIIEPKYITKKIVEPQYVTKEIIEPQYVTKKIVEPQYVTKEIIEPQYVTKRIAEPQYVTKRIAEPQYITKRIVEPKYIEVKHKHVVPKYVTKEIVEPKYVTKEIVEPSFVTKSIEPKYIKVESKSVEPSYITKRIAEPSYIESERYVESPHIDKPICVSTQPYGYESAHLHSHSHTHSHTHSHAIEQQHMANQRHMSYLQNMSTGQTEPSIMTANSFNFSAQESESESNNFGFMIGGNFELPTSPPLHNFSH